MFGRFKRAALGALALTLAVTPSLVSACGGFFGPPNLTVDLNAFRAVFSVGKNNMITEIVSVNYTGKAADFSWVMPLPATPTVDVADESDLDALQANTDPTVSYPVDYCARLNDNPLGLGGGGGGGTLGTVGPYDYAIIKNDNPGQMIQWLRDHGYTIKVSDEPIINQYVKEGNTFVALRLKPGADVQDIQPVVFTYQSSKITIPVRLGAVASSANVPVLAWIFGDGQYAPTNYKRVDRPSLSAARAINETLAMGSLNGSQDANPPQEVYDQGVKAIQGKYRGQAFITEFAGQTKGLLDSLGDVGPALQKMLTSFPYVTRLHAQLSPDQMTLDPLFAPIAGTADVPAGIDLGKVVDPLTLYGCTTHEALDPRIAGEFATSHTTFDALHFDVGHPADWKLSQFTLAPQPSESNPDAQPTTIYAFAPQPVTAQTLDTYFKGGATPPMFVFTELNYSDPQDFLTAIAGLPSDVSNNNHPLNGLLIQALGQNASRAKIQVTAGDNPVGASFWPYRAADGDTFILFGILASRAQWQSNKALFEDMLAYGAAHQYFTGADTKDTLFLRVGASGDFGSDVYELPIPNGWTAQFDSNNDIVIAADQTADHGPAMRLTFVGSTSNPYPDIPFGSSLDAAGNDPKSYTYPADSVQRALSFYGLPGSPNDNPILDAVQHCALNGASAALKPTSFHSGGRTGLVALTDEYIVGVYAPDADFSNDQATLQKLMAAYIAGYGCGTEVQSPDSGTATPGGAVPAATAVTCPKSPAPRLAVGGQGRVTPGTPDNLRQAPNTSAPILTQIPAGGQFTVLQGPSCDPKSGLAWWQVRYKGQTGWLAEGQGQDYFVEPVSG